MTKPYLSTVFSLQRLIREEWELLQKKEREAKEKRERLRRQKEVKAEEWWSTTSCDWLRWWRCKLHIV